LFDYESCLASFTGAFSLFGMLPVVPGPCGLYRYAAIRDEAVPFYIKTVASHPAECGILQANLNLAEDRVLSYAAVMRTHDRAYTAYVPEATFYFEAETKPLMLFTQRRRWINGTVAGYIWLLTNPSIIWTSNLRCWNKPFLTLLLICQVFMYIAVALAPTIFAVSFRWTLPWAQTYFLPNEDRTFADNHISDLIISAYGLLYVIFVCVHARPSQKPAVVSWLVHFVGFINALIMIIIMGSMAVALYNNYLSKGFDMTGSGIQDWITIMVVFTILGPMLLALIHSPLSFFFMLKSFIQFYLLLPTMVVWIGAYAMSRVWDLSWGNRPSEQSSLATKMTKADLQRNGNKIRVEGQLIAYGCMIANIFCTAAILVWSQQADFVVGLALFIFTWYIFDTCHRSTLSALYSSSSFTCVIIGL
jgi:chitin synthase